MKRKAREIALLDNAGALVYRGRAEELPLPRDLIARLSMRFFQDPDPCFIHQGAVRARVALELEQALAGARDDGAPLAREAMTAMGAVRTIWADEIDI